MTRRERRGSRFTAFIGVAGVVGAGMMGLVVGSATASHETDQVPVALHGGYEENHSGASFGSLADEEAEGGPPDLVLVENSAGVEGYVHHQDIEAFWGPAPTSPEEVAAMTQDQATEAAISRALTVPMYEGDGDSYVGEWDGLNRGW